MLDQAHAHNDVNEIDTDNTHGDADDSITGSPNWSPDPKYAAAGNMTVIPDPDLQSLNATYDAWNRLIGCGESEIEIAAIGVRAHLDVW